MKMAERVGRLAEQRERAQRRLESIAREPELRAQRREREERRLERVIENRKRLTPEDQIIAVTTRVPKEQEARIELARSLRVAASGRERSAREVAAIMGVSAEWVWKFWNGTPVRKPKAKPKAPVGKATLVVPPGESTASWLHRRRRAANVSQAKLSRASGIDKALIAAWETGAETPNPSEYLKLTRALDSL